MKLSFWIKRISHIYTQMHLRKRRGELGAGPESLNKGLCGMDRAQRNDDTHAQIIRVIRCSTSPLAALPNCEIDPRKAERLVGNLDENSGAPD